MAYGNVPLRKTEEESKLLLSLPLGTDPSLGAPFFSLVTHPKQPPVLVISTRSQGDWLERRGVLVAASSWGLQLAEAQPFLGSALVGGVFLPPGSFLCLPLPHHPPPHSTLFLLWR